MKLWYLSGKKLYTLKIAHPEHLLMDRKSEQRMVKDIRILMNVINCAKDINKHILRHMKPFQIRIWKKRDVEVLIKENKNNQMSFSDIRKSFPHMIYWQNKFLGIDGIDGIDIMNRNVCHLVIHCIIIISRH